MDLLLTSTTLGIIDIDIDAEGCVKTIEDDAEQMQQAKVAAFFTLGSTPQIPADGVDWQGFITGEKTFPELDSDIRDNIKKIGDTTLYPDYNIVNNHIEVVIKEG
jgi:hypothetical protein